MESNSKEENLLLFLQNLTTPIPLPLMEKIIEIIKNNDINKVKRIIESLGNPYIHDEEGYTIFHYACAYGSEEMVKELKGYYQDANLRILKNGELLASPIEFAIRYNNCKVLKLLFDEFKVNTNDTDNKGNTLLHTAVLTENIDVITFLLEKGIDIDTKNIAGKTALHLAVINNKQEIVETLLKNNANPNIRDNLGYTPLHSACLKGLTEIAKKLIEYNADPDIYSIDGTAIIIAILNNNTEIVKVLLEKNINLDVKNSEGHNPLALAVTKENETIVKLLLEHGTNPNKGNDIKPLHIAAQIGNIKIAKLLLQYNADIDAKTYLGLTPLALAVISKNVEMAKFLIENNANVNAITKENDSIMHFSVELDDQTFIEYLIKHGAKISIKNAEGKTPIHECAKTNKINSLMALLNHGANINLKDNNGNTPLHLAVENQHEEMVKTILKYTKKVNIKNNDGNTPLHLAALKQNSNIFSMLIQNKANTRIKNNDGCTIIDYLWLHQNSYFLANYLTNKSKITNFFNNVSLNKTNAINSYLKTNIKFSVKDNYQKAKEVKELIDKLEKRKDVSEEDIFQVKRIGIILAVKAGNRELIEEYLESDGRLLYVRDEANKSLLEIAFEHLAIGIAMFLIEKGFDIDSFVSTSGNNILHYAAKIDDVDLAIYALIRTKGGLDINKRNAENETPLMIAKRRNSTDVLNVLIANGAIDNTMERIFLRKINVKLNQIKNKISKQFRKRYYDFNF